MENKYKELIMQKMTAALMYGLIFIVLGFIVCVVLGFIGFVVVPIVLLLLLYGCIYTRILSRRE